MDTYYRMNKALPIYEIVFDEDIFESGINLIALTDNPAIEIMGMRFDKHELLSLIFKDEDKKIVAGPAIIPDKPIYRKVDDKEFYVVFTKETIEKMVEKFNSENRELKFNIEHDSDKLIKGFIKGSWIIEDSEKDKSNYYGFTLPEGTWFVEAKISDDTVWKDVIKEMDSVGFSIEGLMGVNGLEFSTNKGTNNSTNTNKNKNDMKKNSIKFSAKVFGSKKKFNLDTKAFEEIKTEDDKVLVLDEVIEGAEVMIDVDGEMIPAEDGTYVIPELNIELVIKAGKVESINEVESEVEVETEMKDKEEKEEMAEEVAVETPAEEAPVTTVATVTPEMIAEMVAKLVDIESRLEALEASANETNKEQFSAHSDNNFSIVDALERIKGLSTK